jgi:hypothetical protein
VKDFTRERVIEMSPYDIEYLILSKENYLCTRTSVPPYIDVLRPLEDKGKHDSPLRCGNDLSSRLYLSSESWLYLSSWWRLCHRGGNDSCHGDF